MNVVNSSAGRMCVNASCAVLGVVYKTKKALYEYSPLICQWTFARTFSATFPAGRVVKFLSRVNPCENTAEKKSQECSTVCWCGLVDGCKRKALLSEWSISSTQVRTQCSRKMFLLVWTHRTPPLWSSYVKGQTRENTNVRVRKNSLRPMLHRVCLLTKMQPCSCIVSTKYWPLIATVPSEAFQKY